MAIKVGTENKRNVIIAAVLFCILIYLGITQIFGGSPTPAPTAKVVPPRSTPQTTVVRNTTPGTTTAIGQAAPAARKLPGTGLDPALHLERLAQSESIEYAGNGRNIFSADSIPPPQIETPLAAARQNEAANAPPVYTPPPVPQPPAIDLRYFGYSANKDGKRQAFLLHGEDIFQASAGDIVDHRFKVVAVDLRSVQVTDLSYNNTQTLPLTGN
jgi:hypothetical protein